MYLCFTLQKKQPACKFEANAIIRKAEEEVKVAEFQAQKTLENAKVAHAQTEAQVKIAELQANTNAQKMLQDAKIAHEQTEAQVKIAELQANTNAQKMLEDAKIAHAQTEAQVKIAELQANTNAQKMLEDANIAHAQTKLQLKQTEVEAESNVMIADAQAKKAEWDAKGKIVESQPQLQGKKREREETAESTTTTPTKMAKKPNTPKPLAERVAECTQNHRNAMSFSHAVYEKMQDLGGNLDIVMVFKYVYEWFRSTTEKQRRGFHVNAPRGMEPVTIVYGKPPSDHLLTSVATECLTKAPSPSYLAQPVVVASFPTVSLLSAALGDLSGDQRIAATTLLIDKFVYSQAMEPWHGVTCFVVRHRETQEIEDITTYVDVQIHPIVRTLQNWLHECTVHNCNSRAPMWSVNELPQYDYPDSAGLGSFSGHTTYRQLVDSHPTVNSFLRAQPRLRGVELCQYLTQAVHPDQTVVLLSCDSNQQSDMDRQWYWMNVVEPQTKTVTFNQLVRIFNWDSVKWEQPAIICILKLLLQVSGLCTPWLDTGSRPTMFPVNMLGHLRRAVFLQSALLKGGTDCFF